MSKRERLLDAMYCLGQLRKSLTQAGIVEYNDCYLYALERILDAMAQQEKL